MTCPTCAVGYEPPLNRMREDIEEACVLSGLDMSLLAVFNPDMGLIHLTAGETNAAHRASVKKYDAHYAFDLEKIPVGNWTWPSRAAFGGSSVCARLLAYCQPGSLCTGRRTDHPCVPPYRAARPLHLCQRPYAAPRPKPFAGSMKMSSTGSRPCGMPASGCLSSRSWPKRKSSW